MGTREGSPAEPSQNLTLVSSGSHAAGNIPVARLCGVVGSPDLEKPEWLEGRREQERGERHHRCQDRERWRGRSEGKKGCWVDSRSALGLLSALMTAGPS